MLKYFLRRFSNFIKFHTFKGFQSLITDGASDFYKYDKIIEKFYHKNFIHINLEFF